MRLDHVSYVSSHDQISDVVNRIGSQIGTAFIDGGVHPKFGTRNFTAPLLGGQYIEIVCPMDHPATDATPFGRAVKSKSQLGGGWMAWVISTNTIELFEESFNRKAVNAIRRLPSGEEISWKQIGVLDIIENSEVPFFIQWQTSYHPSKIGSASSNLELININGEINKVSTITSTNKEELKEKFKVAFSNSEKNLYGIESVIFKKQDKFIEIQ
jgi:hypothetical protein